MPEIDPFVLEIQNLKVKAAERKFWQTMKALDMAERAFVADVLRIHRERRRCEYCWGGNGPEFNLRLVQLRAGNEWTQEQFIGEKCREYLRGYFRYMKEPEQYDPMKVTP